MDPTPSGGYTTGSETIPVGDRIVGEPSYARPVLGTPVVTGENVLTARNRVQWGPVFAGIFTALPVFILMTILGIAIGASVLGPRNEAGEIGTWAAVWGAISAMFAFLVGGWVAAKTAAVEGSFSGLVNGFLVGATGLALILWMTASGLGNLFGTIGANAGDLINAAQNTAQQQGIPPAQAGAQAQDQAAQAVDNAQQALDQAANNPNTFENVRNGAFATFLGYLLPLLAAALGGYLGHYKREELIRGTG